MIFQKNYAYRQMPDAIEIYLPGAMDGSGIPCAA